MKPSLALYLVLMGSILSSPLPSSGQENRIPANPLQKAKLIPAKRKKVSLKTSIYQISSDSTFFWDKNLVHLRRDNPQGLGIIPTVKVPQFAEVLKLQEAQLLSSPRMIMMEGGKAQMGVHARDKAFFFKVNQIKLENDSFEMDIRFGLGKVFGENEPKPQFDCPYKGAFPLGSSLFLVSRSRDPKDKSNYIFILTPTLQD